MKLCVTYKYGNDLETDEFQGVSMVAQIHSSGAITIYKNSIPVSYFGRNQWIKVVRVQE